MKYLVQLLQGADEVFLRGHFRSRVESKKEEVRRHTTTVSDYIARLGSLRKKWSLNEADMSSINEIERYIKEDLETARRYCRRNLPKDQAREFEENCRKLKRDYESNYSI